ncbi:hypothetical protein A2856_02095 [Candidatus Uhrbacteria bacterium RIFCSPHIGHO2_01_FULL_63_20]|uniref:Uncharacterized protein n=1 Tax=Candidatus Uhrbacteria bacterium RIFCSPHIGHO2_01_FULL_63_20 TaxID=1802385 RepID=A0A1F7TKF2_9BACT|nr:MAG: hypothetical protein A2856_02095 [Candidatus Uhrbacteria bacterium RIFCSPHIGHO2_01_FULL_63_20]
MKLRTKQLSAALVAAAEGKEGKALDETVRAFLGWMKDNGHLSRIREVIRGVDAAWRERYGVSSVTVESAHPLSAKVKQAVTKLSKGADVAFVTNPALIGGARVRVDDRVIDNTVLGRANRLKQTLMERI